MISVTDLKNYVYCPYIVYIRKVLGLPERITEYMMYGREIEHEQIVLFLYRAFQGVKLLRNLYLSSRRLKLQGCVEYVIVDKYGYYVPVDIKWSEVEDKPKRDHVVQICAYALLVEECGLGKVKQCGLYYVTRSGGKLFRIVYTRSMRQLVLKVLENVRKIVEENMLPQHVPDDRRCFSCPARQVCNFRRC